MIENTEVRKAWIEDGEWTGVMQTQAAAVGECNELFLVLLIMSFYVLC